MKFSLLLERLLNSSLQKIPLAGLSVQFLGYLSPREDDIWVFGSFGENVFWENPKYFFLYVSNEKKDSEVRPIWISKSREMAEELRDSGYEAYYYRSLDGLWFSLKSGKCFFSHRLSDVNGGFLGGIKGVNFYHGAALKRFNWAEPQAGRFGIVKLLKRHLFNYFYNRYDVGILSSNYLKNVYRTAEFDLADRFVVTGFPRNDVLFEEIKDWEIGTDTTFIENVQKPAKNVIMYLPTYRRDSDHSFKDVIDLDKLDRWAESEDSIVIFKLHPMSNFGKNDVENYDNLYLLKKSIDLQPLLKETDILISDYSSVHNDFLLLDRAIVFYPFDFEEYREKRGFVRDYDNFTPGPKAYSFEELIESLDEVMEEDNYEEERKEIRDKIFDYQDGKSSERVWEEVRNL